MITLDHLFYLKWEPMVSWEGVIVKTVLKNCTEHWTTSPQVETTMFYNNNIMNRKKTNNKWHLIVVSRCWTQIKQRSKRRLHMTTSQMRAQSRAVSKQDYKLFCMLLILMISFFIMWSPIFIFAFLILMHNFQVHLPITSSMFVWVLTFTMANSALNPVLYSLYQLKHKWQRLCCATAITPGQRARTE